MKRGLKMCTIEKIRVNGSRPGRITKSKAVRNLFGTTPDDNDSWLKQELEQAFLQDRKKMVSLGLDPDTGMPAENNTSRWEWTAVEGISCPKMYRSKDLLSKFVNLSTKSSLSAPNSIVFSSENNRLDTVTSNNIVCSTISTNTSTVNQDASQTPKQYKQTTITDFMPQRRHRLGLIRDQLSPVFRSNSRQKNLERSVQNSAMTIQDSTTEAQ